MCWFVFAYGRVSVGVDERMRETQRDTETERKISITTEEGLTFIKQKEIARGRRTASSRKKRKR
jgi:hypothetical protein